MTSRWLEQPAHVREDDGPLPAGFRAAGGKLLRHAEVFDVYPREGQTSLALRLEFRAPDRTLTDEDVTGRREKIVAAVAEKLGGELRG